MTLASRWDSSVPLNLLNLGLFLRTRPNCCHYYLHRRLIDAPNAKTSKTFGAIRIEPSDCGVFGPPRQYSLRWACASSVLLRYLPYSVVIKVRHIYVACRIYGDSTWVVELSCSPGSVGKSGNSTSCKRGDHSRGGYLPYSVVVFIPHIDVARRIYGVSRQSIPDTLAISLSDSISYK